MYTFRISPDACPTFEDALEKAKKQVRDGEDVTFVIGNELFLSEPIFIDNDPFFDGSRQITFRGENNAVVTGAFRVTDFTRVNDTLWRACLPDTDMTRHVVIDGKYAPRPHTAPVTAFGWDETTGDTGFYEENGEVTGLVTTRREILTWKNIRDTEAVFNVGWTHHVIPVTGVHELADGRVYIRLMEAPFRASRRMAGVKIGGCPTCFDNVFEELHEPLSWYFDRTERALYLCLAPSDTPENHTVELCRAEELLHFAGTPQKPMKNIRFENLTFRGTTFLRPSLYGHAELQAGFLRTDGTTDMPKREKPYELDNTKLPGTLRFVACHDVSFEHCTFTCLASSALTFEYGAAHCRVTDCEFSELGASALVVGDVMSDRSHHPSDEREAVKDVSVSDCTVCRTGLDFSGTAAILLGYVADCAVVHNDIHDVPYSGVSVGWGWGGSDISVGDYRKTPWKTPSSAARNNISFNHIHHCMMKLYDGGAIYTLGAMEGTVIRGNLIHHAGGCDVDGCRELAIGGVLLDGVKTVDLGAFQKLGPFPGGIYLDEGSRGILVTGNILYATTVPLFYHNQINDGYKMVTFADNSLQVRPEDPAFPKTAAAYAGRRK